MWSVIKLTHTAPNLTWTCPAITIKHAFPNLYKLPLTLHLTQHSRESKYVEINRTRKILTDPGLFSLVSWLTDVLTWTLHTLHSLRNGSNVASNPGKTFIPLLIPIHPDLSEMSVLQQLETRLWLPLSGVCPATIRGLALHPQGDKLVCPPISLVLRSLTHSSICSWWCSFSLY